MMQHLLSYIFAIFLARPLWLDFWLVPFVFFYYHIGSLIGAGMLFYSWYPPLVNVARASVKSPLPRLVPIPLFHFKFDLCLWPLTQLCPDRLRSCSRNLMPTKNCCFHFFFLHFFLAGPFMSLVSELVSPSFVSLFVHM